MTKVHVLADESLGGVLREYVEVDRPPDEGDLIVCTKECALGGRFYGDGDVGVMQYKSDDYSSIYVKFLEGFGGPVSEGECYVGNDAYTTLEPTDIVHIDGQRYRMVERKAEVGEKVIIVNDEYRVLVPLESSEEPLTTTADKPEDMLDLLANLARRVTSLERQLADTQRNLEKFAQQTESNTHDIAFLDERTAPTFNESQLTAVLRAVMVAAGGDGE